MTTSQPLPWVICAIFRNESRYLREWVEFHLLQGAERLYLYNNRSDDDFLTVLAPYLADGTVHLVPWPLDPPCQLQAYQHRLLRLAGRPLWCAFLDCDEFLFAPAHATVTDALACIPRNWGAVGVNWLCFGSGGQQVYEPGLVTERFTWRADSAYPFNLHVKSIIRMDQEVDVGPTPHHFNVQRSTFTEQGCPLYGPLTHAHSSRLLRINHYCSKSRTEWLERAALGKPDRPDTMRSDPAWYDERQAMDVDDRDIQRFLPQLYDRLHLEVPACR